MEQYLILGVRRIGRSYVSSFTHDIQREIYQNSDSLIQKRIMKYEDIIKRYNMYQHSPVFFSSTETKYEIKSKKEDMKNKVYSWIACTIYKGEVETAIDNGEVIATSEENAKMKIILLLKEDMKDGIDPDEVKIFLRQWR